MNTALLRRLIFFNCALVWLTALLCHARSASPAGVPPLDEMAGDWLPMKDVANPPDVNNFHDMLMVNRDLTSFFCNPEDWLWVERWKVELWLSAGHADNCRQGISGDGMSLVSVSRPASQSRLRRAGGGNGHADDQRAARRARPRANRQSVRRRKPTWNWRCRFQALLQPDGISVLNTNQRPGFATVICPATKPDSVTNDNGVVRWQWKVALSAGGKKEIEFVAGDGHAADSQKVQADVTRWRKHFSAEFDGFKQCWEQRWADAFTPGNQHFSGNLPVLVTDNAALKRNYYMGIVTMLELERTQFPVHPRSFITSGERAPGTQFYWDASMQSTVWALLEPAGMKATLRRWLVQNPRSGQVIYLTETNGFDAEVHDHITGYAFNACTIFKTALDYLRVTGDHGFSR